MSIVSIVYLPEGIAMAADSRLTGSRSTTDTSGAVTVEKFPISDNAQKIVLLSKCPVGIASVGTAIINSQTISDYIRLFEIDDIVEGDTPEIVADKLLLRQNEFTGTKFYVCGYSQDVPYVFVVSSTGKVRKNVEQGGDIVYSFMWGGEPEALNKLVNSTPVMNTNERLMPLKDGIDLAEFMVDLTIKYQRFSSQIRTCGGPIDILVLTKDGAFWHKHKLFSGKKNSEE